MTEFNEFGFDLAFQDAGPVLGVSSGPLTGSIAASFVDPRNTLDLSLALTGTLLSTVPTRHRPGGPDRLVAVAAPREPRLQPYSATQ